MADDKRNLIPDASRKSRPRQFYERLTDKNGTAMTSSRPPETYGAIGQPGYIEEDPPGGDYTTTSLSHPPLSPDVTVVKPHTDQHQRSISPGSIPSATYKNHASANNTKDDQDCEVTLFSKSDNYQDSVPSPAQLDVGDATQRGSSSDSDDAKNNVSVSATHPSHSSFGFLKHVPFLRKPRFKKDNNSSTENKSNTRAAFLKPNSSSSSNNYSSTDQKQRSSSESDPLFQGNMENKGAKTEDIEMSVTKRTKEGESTFFVYYLACFATIGGLLFGYDTGIVSGSMLLIEDYFDLNTIWKELIVSGTVGSAAVFAFIGGFACDIFGRKKTIMAASVVFVAGAVLMGASTSKEMLLGGRIVVGVGIGFASMTVPVYVAEAAPLNIRGRLVTLNQLFITIGILVSSLIAGGFSEMKETGWRYMLGLAALPGVIQFIGFIFLPESPRWLVAQGQEERAKEVLQKIRAKSDVDDEMADIKAAIEKGKSQSGWVLGRVMKTPHVRKALFVGCGLQIFQQICGINTVIYYSATILRMSGFPAKDAIWLVAVPNTVNFLATIAGVMLVERLGRKKLLLGSFIGVMIALAVLATGFQLSANFSPDLDPNVTETYGNGSLIEDECYEMKYSSCEICIEHEHCGFCYEGSGDFGTCLRADPEDEDLQAVDGRCNGTNLGKLNTQWAHGYCPTDFTWMAVLGLGLFVLGFAPGLGPMPWTINSEIYPHWARGTCTSIATACNWIFNLIVSLFFLTLTEAITKYGAFWLFGALCFLGFIFTAVFVPETKNKSLEEVQRLFMGERGFDNVGYVAEFPRPDADKKTAASS